MNSSPRLFSHVLKTIKHSRLIEEAHPFFIYPARSRAYPIAPKFLAQRMGRTAGMYVPMMMMFFGWPFAAKKLITVTGGP